MTTARIAALLVSICVQFNTSAIAEDSQPFAIAIHGGAGTITRAALGSDQEKQIRDVLKKARDEGYKILEQGGSGLDAVVTAINILETSTHFNAGRGAVYNHEGMHELDASIMRGDTLAAGAVAGVKRIEHPISLARLVMERSQHVMLSGKGAEQFAVHNGMKLVDNAIFDTERRYQQLLKAKNAQANNHSLPTAFKMGTVGAVVLDKAGNLYAGTSTGGMTNKRYGRIGDSPIIGAGTYANNSSCAVSATGHGEYFIRYQVASDICARMQYQGLSVEDASNKVINEVLVSAGGTGGVIVVDSAGRVAMPFNTEGMYRAARSNVGLDEVKIYKRD